MATETMSMKRAAAKVLEEADGPLHTDEITKRALDRQLVRTKGRKRSRDGRPSRPAGWPFHA